MNSAYKGRDNVSWDAMQRHLKTGKPQEMTETEIRAVLEELPTLYPTGRLSIPKLSETQSQLLPYVGARYGSDTREKVTASLSEFMETVSRIPSISERQRIALNFSQNFLNYGLSERDALILQTAFLNHAGMERVVWEAEITPKNTIVIRARLNK